MKVHYKLDAIGKIESFTLVEEDVQLSAGFMEADSEQEFERITGYDLDGTTCDYSEKKSRLKATDSEITRPFEDLIVALMQAKIDLPLHLVQKVIDKQEKRNQFIGTSGVIITKQGSCYHTDEECPSIIDADTDSVTLAEAVNDGLVLCSKCK